MVDYSTPMIDGAINKRQSLGDIHYMCRPDNERKSEWHCVFIAYIRSLLASSAHKQEITVITAAFLCQRKSR
jgi:hypothetical protein